MKKEALLRAIAKRLRFKVLEITTRAGSGHPTSCLSLAEIISCLFFEEMRYNIKRPNDLGNDEFILSKGHASPILWAAFAEAGVIKEKDLEGYRKINSVLEGHPTPRMPWIKASTGSLGQGLSMGLGLAMAQRMLKLPSKTFVVLGDGECAEGNVWEAAEIAAKHNVSNLTAIMDVNRLAQSDESLHGHNVAAWERKWAAFGWHTQVIDGHNVYEILKALKRAKTISGPCAIIALTQKGKGISLFENKEGWHGKPLTKEQLDKSILDLGTYPRVNVSKRAPRKVKLRKLKSAKPKMPKYNSTDVLATRQAYGDMLKNLGVDERVIALDADVKNSTFSLTFKKAFPKRFIDCYIAEQNMASMGVGLSAIGFKPFINTFAAFLERAHDQIRMAAISKANITFVGSHCGVSIGEDGPSQMALEDIAMFRCIPHSVILYPSDAISAAKCTALLAKHKGISFLRTSRPKTPILYKAIDAFQIGGSKIILKPKKSKFVIITAGVTVHEALKAAKNSKNAIVIDAYSIKPLDKKTIRKECKGKQVIVVEDHYAQGGLGAAVRACGLVVDNHLCVTDFPRSGKGAELMSMFKIDAIAISRVLKK